MEQVQFHNYLRLIIISNGQGGARLREIFRERYQGLTGTSWKDGTRTSLDFHKTVGKQTFQKQQKLQRKMLMTGDVNQWDFALLAEVIQKIDYSHKKNELSAQYRFENERISDLMKIRNQIEHLPKKAIGENEFLTLWDSVSSALVSLGVSFEDISHVKSAKDINVVQFLNVPGLFNQENIEKANQLREKGNLVVRNSQNFEKAINLYTDALGLYGLPPKDRGTMYSNRSAAYLMLLAREDLSYNEDEKQDKLSYAENDAKEAISLRPAWCKGYFRLWKVLQLKREWSSAISAFNSALYLNEGNVDLLRIRNERDKCRVGILRDGGQNQLDPNRLPYNLDEFQKHLRFEERGAIQDPKDVMEWRKQLLKSDDPELRADSLAFFALRHMEGADGYQRDYKKAYELFTQAGSAGNAVGLYNVGLFHCNGYGVTQNVPLAVSYFRKASKCPVTPFNVDGIRLAQHALGLCYELGLGVPVDYKVAVKWHELAVANGTGLGSASLARMYLQGRGVEQSLERAIQYFKLSAVRGEVVSMETLVDYYRITGNEKQAQMWLSQSLKAGSIRSVLSHKVFGGIGEFFVRKLSQIPQSPTALRFLKASNPMRVDIVRHHRTHLRQSNTRLEGCTYFKRIRTVPYPANQQKSPAHLSGLEEITFDDMKLTIDQDYKGYVLQLTIMEDLIFNHMKSIMANVRDNNGDFMRCNLYNMDHNDKDLQRKITFGSKISVLNPYYRLTADRGTAIRVDDPKSIIFEHVSNEDKEICRFCWRPNPKHSCGQCKRVKYCGRECQEQDWKLLKHKLICQVHLNNNHYNAENQIQVEY